MIIFFILIFLCLNINVLASDQYHDTFDLGETYGELPVSDPEFYVSNCPLGKQYFDVHAGEGVGSTDSIAHTLDGGAVHAYINFTTDKQIESISMSLKFDSVLDTLDYFFRLQDDSGIDIFTLKIEEDYEIRNGYNGSLYGIINSPTLYFYLNFTFLDENTVNVSMMRVSDGLKIAKFNSDTIGGRDLRDVEVIQFFVQTVDGSEVLYIDDLIVTFSDDYVPGDQQSNFVFRLADCEYGIVYDLYPIGTMGPFESYTYISNTMYELDGVEFNFTDYGYGRFVQASISGLTEGVHTLSCTNVYNGSFFGFSWNYPETGGNYFHYKRNYSIYIVPFDPLEIHLTPVGDPDSLNFTDAQRTYYEGVHGINQFVEFYNQEVDSYYRTTDEPIIVYNLTQDWLFETHKLLAYDIVYGENIIEYSSFFDLTQGDIDGIFTVWEYIFREKGYYRIKVYSYDSINQTRKSHVYTSKMLFVETMPLSPEEFQQETESVAGPLTYNQVMFLLGFFIFCIFLAVGAWICHKLKSKELQKLLFATFGLSGVVFNAYYSFWGIWIVFILGLFMIFVIVLTLYKRS